MNRIEAEMRSEKGFETRVIMYPKVNKEDHVQGLINEHSRFVTIADNEYIDVNIIDVDKNKYSIYHLVHCVLSVKKRKQENSMPAEIERLHDLLNGAKANLEDATARAEKAEAERDEARAATKAAYERAASITVRQFDSFGDGFDRPLPIVVQAAIRALATEAETTALAENNKKES